MKTVCVCHLSYLRFVLCSFISLPSTGLLPLRPRPHLSSLGVSHPFADERFVDDYVATIRDTAPVKGEKER